MKQINVLVIVPPFVTLPAVGHGGTERIAEGMINELLRIGHKVTLLGAGNCQTPANFVRIFEKTISEQKADEAHIEASRSLRIETAYITKVMKYLQDTDGRYDVVFNHMRGGYLLLPLAQHLRTPIISTMHLPIFKEVSDVLSLYSNPNVVTISNSQRKPASQVNFLATIYNGLSLGEFSFNDKPRDYFVFMGAMGEHKSPHLAIRAAKEAGVNLILAGGKKREPYFSNEVSPLIDNKQIKYIGEVSGKERIDLLRNAKGFLFPITWEEPFGLVVIEAMACGTPVIAFNHGAMSEIITDGVDGFISDDFSEMVRKIRLIEKIKRKNCRTTVEKRFTYEVMTASYLKAFESLANKK